MPKLKTHSGAKKRFRLTASGKIKMTPAGKRHGMRKRTNEMLRTARGMRTMHPSDARKITKVYLLNDQ
ncbi:MAG: 50S ribosomal protein L35 [Alphaproteobacteria bacterium]|jgi:large subunit ribosomal protein L35|nr:50S ribosomal protein L35 [Alphaproteobacteria bacterium]MBP9877978.1 50S ribosomal protein L35 [Alphaproteobacteria bacterium]